MLVARCEVRYSGRLSAVLPEAVRLLIFKADGSVLVHDDAGGYKPLNWMTAPTFVEDKEMVEAQQARMTELGEQGLVDIASDANRMTMRRMIERMIAEENGALAAE